MNEFEWLRQMRELNQPVAPRNDLWARIDAALDENDAPADIAAPTPVRPARRPRLWAMAAGLAAVAVLAGGVAWHMRTLPQMAPGAPLTAQVQNWKPSDPRLASAAIELGAARMELQQAIEQAPDSPALQRLLQRTDAQQARLRELEKQAG
ncbi:MAG TPA: hypothetical protein VME63_05035 [Dyella sp.]|uniref:hypothetical protein n=1 Tax=Dyella sp. TaxID=1869338 RepID=UPI002C580EB2|nr:hypothetical protein [Dyella sp.]HTV84744.1 hypothetical protein [Dyella sp.]